jgi:hypothetical protein
LPGSLTASLSESEAKAKPRPVRHIGVMEAKKSKMCVIFFHFRFAAIQRRFI